MLKFQVDCYVRFGEYEQSSISKFLKYDRQLIHGSENGNKTRKRSNTYNISLYIQKGIKQHR